ncbi:hypothetical protein ONZ51_g5102 [Trametes cubensis]|uniref:Uncharacterized protein n=1 Tax=Trametes cubensis TaxID=1111947 RepID=A0AAD7TUM3_9APHY|nr:hypothetical protein ONZ51_g5102 [Trametes cubensis]
MISGFTVFDVVVGVTGLLALIGQCLYWIIKRRLPATKLRVLEDTLSDTQSLLTTCLEEGRLGGDNAADHFQDHLNDIKKKVSDVKLELSRASTYMDHFKTMMTGLSQRIDRLCQETTTLRVQISITSSERQQAELQVAASQTTDPSLAQTNGSAHPETHRPNVAPTTFSASALTPTGSEVASNNIRPSWDNGTCAPRGEAAMGVIVRAAEEQSAQPGMIIPAVSVVFAVPTNLVREDGRGDDCSLSESLLPSTKDVILPTYRLAAKRTLRRKKRLNDAVARTRAFARFLRRSCA